MFGYIQFYDYLYFDSFLLFDMNKLMTEEHFRGLTPSIHPSDQHKRKRTPSQYASQIENFKIDNTSQLKKAKSIRFNDQTSSPQESIKNVSNRPLNCVLPSGKIYALKVIVSPNPSVKKQKKQRSRPVKPQLNPVKSTIEKQQDNDKSLLQKFLDACKLLQNKQEKDSNENNQSAKENNEAKIVRYEQKVKKERQREEKWNKCYEKYRLLVEKLQRLQENYVFLV